MKNRMVVPENRTDNDYFDSKRTEKLLDLQDENAQKSAPKPKNYLWDLDGCNDRKEPRCFCE